MQMMVHVLLDRMKVIHGRDVNAYTTLECDWSQGFRARGNDFELSIEWVT